MKNSAAVRFLSASLFASMMVLDAPAKAETGPFFEVSGVLIGKIKKSGKVEPAENLSGIACDDTARFPRNCLLIDDEAQSAQLVVVEDGKIIAGKAVTLTTNTFDGKPLEFDGEGVGFENNAFYVIGSHGHPRDKGNTEDQPEDREKFAEKIRTVSVIQRVSIDPTSQTVQKITPSAALRPLLDADKDLHPFFDQRLEKNGLTIEGVSIRDGQLYAGLRSPVLDSGKQAAIFKVSLDSLFEGGSEPRELIKLALGEWRGVRDLVRYANGFLILAGPSGDPDKKLDIPSDAYTVFWWDGSKTLEPLGNIEGVKVKTKWAKPEAILPLDVAGDRLRILVLFDGVTSDFAARADKIRKPAK